MPDPIDESPKALIVPLDRLRWACNVDDLGIESTAQVQKLEEKVLAQQRAVSALEFGMGMGGNDYNIFVVGEPRTGMTYLTRSFVKEAAQSQPSPQDWVYVHNFLDPDRPRAISLPKGLARELARDMDELVDDLKNQIPEAFQSDEYRQRREEPIKQFTIQRNELLAALEATVNAGGFILNMSQEGMMIAPAKDGHVMTEEDLQQLTEEQKSELRKKSEELQEEMNRTVLKIRKLEKELREKHKDLERRVGLYAVGYLLDELQEKYAELRPVLDYLHEVKNDIIKNLGDFKPKEQPPTPYPIPRAEADYTRYKVNVLIDNSEVAGAPVVYEVNPTYTNLFGAMERRASFGALFTDFTMIRPGSIHRANGGYVVIQARDLFKWFISWEALKRALKNREIKIEDPAEMYGFITTKGLTPEPIPLKVKIILIGEPYIYHLLLEHDDQFRKLFKVKVHLDDVVDCQREEVLKYASFAARVVEQRGLKHVDKTGLARLLEYGVELSGRQKKLTLKMAMIRDALRESDYWAKAAGSDMILREHVDKAIRLKKLRSSLPEDKVKEFVRDGYVNLETGGDRVGQINGLSVYDLGDHVFGRPARITAAISLGRQGLVDIEREAKLAGHFHTKGVLIMEGYLRGRYAMDRPLSLSASLVFEQSYGMVDGDSASAAELCVLLSGLAGVGLKQSFAMTGAISQQGEILPVGGVTQKIEGFFDLCAERGLSGDQGVIIPQANVQDLMLKTEVIEAASSGRFTIYAVKHADEALELLTGMPAGARQEDGTFPVGTFNRRVEDRLLDLHQKALKLLKEEEKAKAAQPEGDCRTCGQG